MLTRCHACQACFRVRAEHLSAAGGYVTCGACDHVFNAVDALVEDAAPPAVNVAVSEVADKNEVATESATQASTQIPASAPPSPASSATDSKPAVDFAPAFLQQKKTFTKVVSEIGRAHV